MDLELLTGTKASDADVAEVKSKFNPSDTANVNITPYQIYSTTEQVIGEWLGSPLYQKVITATAPSLSAGKWTILTSLATNCSIVDYKAYAIITESDIRPLPWSPNFLIRIYPNAYSFSVFANASADVTTYKDKTIRLIVRYTKS